MPKENIDYSNTIIYKIRCKDINVSDIYIGHTTNFVKRKNQHKTLIIDNLSNNHLENINISAIDGEIIGIFGVVGNGQSELLRALAGLDAFNGKVIISDNEYFNKNLSYIRFS